MNWLLPYSANTFEQIGTHYSNLTRTPLQLASFKNLTRITFTENNQSMTVAAGTFYSNQIESIELQPVGSVEEGAFQGIILLANQIHMFSSNII